MNYYALLPLISFVANILLGIYILYINYKSTENQLFFMLTFSVASWSILHFFMFSADTTLEALSWGRFDTWFSTLTTVFVLHFLIVYTKYKLTKTKKYILISLYIFSVIFGLLDQETFLIEKTPVLHFWGYFSPPGDLYILPSILVIMSMIMGLVIIIKFYSKSKSKNEKRQALLLFMALSLPVFGGIITEFIPTMFDIKIIPLTTTLTSIMALIFGYTIQKYKFLIPLRYEYKKVQEEFRKLFLTFNALPDSIVLITHEGKILETNRAMDEEFSDSDMDLIGRNVYNLLPENIKEKRKELVFKALSTDKTQKNEDAMKNKYFQNLYIPTKSMGGEDNLLMISKDITEQKEAEQERRKLEKQMQQSQRLRALGTMAGGIAHDFKNILTPILGFSNIALKKLDSSISSYIYIEEINKAAKRAKEVIDQILRFSRESEIKKKPIYLQEIVKEALKLLQQFLPSNIEIKENINTSSDKVLADATQMHEVITNLCTNAVHAMEEQGGILEVTLQQVHVDKKKFQDRPDLEEKDYVQLSISDNGIGMTKEIQERIFDPFFSTKEIDKGTGLGLSVVHGIIKDHKGAIIVSSKKGEGSVFSVYLPVYRNLH